MRLRRVRPGTDGWRRRRRGRGFSYLDENGGRLGGDDVARCKALAIPPAWTDVWICPLANGHIQAVGTDDAGRRQYLYHPEWRGRRDRDKHERVLLVGRRLPRARRRVADHLALPAMTRERALATAFMLLDIGLFRVGGENYTEDNGSFGLATVEKRHVRIEGDTVVFDYPAKSGQRRIVTIDDPAVVQAVIELRRRRGGGRQLLAYRDDDGWHDVTSRDIGDYVKSMLGADVSTKDFRTWHGTVRAASALAAAARRDDSSPTRARRRAHEQVAEELGNTPAVAQRSYIDPRVTEKFDRGETIPPPPSDAEVADRRRSERAVLRLLDDAGPTG